jgi:hypothetical protein
MEAAVYGSWCPAVTSRLLLHGLVLPARRTSAALLDGSADIVARLQYLMLLLL